MGGAAAPSPSTSKSILKSAQVMFGLLGAASRVRRCPFPPIGNPGGPAGRTARLSGVTVDGNESTGHTLGVEVLERVF